MDYTHVTSSPASPTRMFAHTDTWSLYVVWLCAVRVAQMFVSEECLREGGAKEEKCDLNKLRQCTEFPGAKRMKLTPKTKHGRLKKKTRKPRRISQGPR
jgi:hypothetical protein